MFEVLIVLPPAAHHVCYSFETPHGTAQQSRPIWPCLSALHAHNRSFASIQLEATSWYQQNHGPQFQSCIEQ
ncbi:hypothetical protein FA13DRAFT_1082673 [Coprinellus micaceus]|uniref:Uncharacterized protein n=1 Tax=Coprinellus micaceus TaxID=71717 RepID=A0A4Y7TRE9_COPMI|nr:hypothetical protein FA13DRAFT_1082673 [Coprinellus micaceus]